MAQTPNKTQETHADVEVFLAAVEPEARQADARAVCNLMAKVSGEPARMWGSTIVGFGSYHYRYDSGREGDAPLVGFSPRKAALTLYIMSGHQDDALMARLGKYKTGKACLYLNKLSDVDQSALAEVIPGCVNHMREAYPAGGAPKP
ncbi:DUF1801 domain-containing protein [Phenylobacterium sp.]|uniref:DUF1801 domain-containing protein n=1 Tax=Phenylobacterium sp. TaxID=1871053 RepID=UPI00286E2B30|nr:DUF1801 domain-containing protein [Phenylobacterium sp.]